MGIFSRKTSKIEDSDSALSNDNYSAPDDFGSDMLDSISSLSVDDLKLSGDENDEEASDQSKADPELEVSSRDVEMDIDDSNELESEVLEPETVALDALNIDVDDATAEAQIVAELESSDDFEDDFDPVDESIFEPSENSFGAAKDLEAEADLESAVELETEAKAEDVADLEPSSEMESFTDAVTEYEPLDHAAAMQAIVPKQTNRISHELANFVEGFDEVASDYELLNGLLAKASSRNAAMQRYASTLRTEAARNSLISEELEKVVADNDRINGIVAAQNTKIMQLETDLESVSKLKAGLKEELAAALNKYEETQGSLRLALEETKRAQDEAENFAITINENNKLIEKLEHEGERLRDAKASTEAKLTEARKELSDLAFSSSELSMQHEKLSKLQKKMLIEHEKLSEEHRSLHRDFGIQQTKIADMEIKNERLKAENQDVAGRLASEKFSMKKDHEALNSELSIVRKQNAGLAFENKNMGERLRVAEAERAKAKDALEDLTRSLSNGRKELSSANLSISELNLKYSADLLTLDQLRDENRELRARVDSLQSEKMKLADYESQAKIAAERADKLEAKLAEYADGLSLASAEAETSESKTAKSPKVVKAPKTPTNN
jgi:chromosome segregation ATPase